MKFSARRRHALSTFLALVLAVESVSAVAAAATRTIAARDAATETVATTDAGQLALPGGSVLDSTSATTDGSATTDAATEAGAAPADFRSPAWLLRGNSEASRTSSQADAVPTPHLDRSLTSPKAPKKSSSTASSSTAATSSTARTGRNHVWIPELGVNRSVSSFACSRSAAPDNLVYRWGCAGRNNVYLLGHAWGVFKPLHDAYTSHRLHTGMKAYYADNSGKVHTYVVKWWRVVAPTTSASWAWASLGTPSMTLQTCVGSNSKYRLMVRLVQVR